MKKWKLTKEAIELLKEWIEEERKDNRMLFEHEIREKYDDMIDDCHEEIKIFGYSYSPSWMLKNTDEVVYDQGFFEFVDDEYVRISEIFDYEPEIDYYYAKYELLDSFLGDNYLEICDYCEIITPTVSYDENICQKCLSKKN